ncbi:LysE family translocator [Undibacterium sp. RTI2.1]|uniref:LysE family translocator n=1 Tax=unclassified Undibacterium TaxID=2630295 RepID=UPI002AB41875|nr:MULTISPECIES: LysE family translocator [unclassified Undibacterium]MDY7540292.1 LysE family translocator [Undibacterium sp. 5I1]MEB0029900.1 LysE family translocator [Undibacterium sp. RTI2.1]MEB0118092.1 LysE family translocator [Undibacterium sp. RTI2.2]MEB0231291.1 LysE family translocator [Undibacterium sp. 10I3]MEB0259056.1 LysE family translocator [Undibacterium sp. 5I1]
MFGTQDLALFIVSGLLLNLVPGPDSLLIMTRSASQGWRAGSAAALGIGTGTFVHIFAAAMGLSAVLASSAAAFMIVKLIGAAYLLYVGVGLLLAKSVTASELDTPVTKSPDLGYKTIFQQGFLTNVLNPKVAVFFLAFVPQFIAASASNKALAFIVLGCIFNFNGMLWCHFLAVSTALASQRVRVNKTVSAWLNRLIGAMFVSFGIKLALSSK